MQLNGPDPLIWIIIYLIPSIVSFLTLKTQGSKYFQCIGPIYLIIALYLYLNNLDLTILNIFDETTNELLDLVICSAWIFILPYLIKLK